MRHLNGVYTQAFNRRHHRVGHLFQGRFKAILIQKDNYLLKVCRYVVLNPVRAKVVSYPEQWRWSSYPATVGTVCSHQCLTKEWILAQFGSVSTVAEREHAVFVNVKIEPGSTWQKVKAQSILGKEDFSENLEGYIKGRRNTVDIPHSQRYLNRPGLDSLFTDVFQNIHKRNEKIAEAVHQHGYRQKEVADHLDMHFSSVSRIIRNGKNI